MVTVFFLDDITNNCICTGWGDKSKRQVNAQKVGDGTR